jgi:predicted RNA polymerase sigma factor
MQYTIVRLNRAVALAEVRASLQLYDAARVDLLRRAGRYAKARSAYDAALALVATSAKRLWLERQRATPPE